MNTEDSLNPAEEGPAPAEKWDREAARRSLDELFTLARQYKSSGDYYELLRFVARFRFYSPFNALLTHIQMPGAGYVAPAHRWRNLYKRRIRADARTLVILRPKGPVMFVFDVSDTEPEPGAPPLPPEILNPFAIHVGHVKGELGQTIENAKRDGISVTAQKAGSQSAGRIAAVEKGGFLQFLTRVRPQPEYIQVPLRYEILLNEKHSKEEQYTTLAHELAHLYCGHLGTPGLKWKWWPDRRGLKPEVEEFEAESVSHLVCSRLGIQSPSAEYLSEYVKQMAETPPISFERVFSAAGLIEEMGSRRLKPREEKK